MHFDLGTWAGRFLRGVPFLFFVALLLLAAQFACIASLLLTGVWRRYRLLTGLLAFQLAAVAVYKPGIDLYLWLAGPVLAFRFLAALEVCHRQTSHFRYWSGLTAAAMLLALFYVASVIRPPVDDFQTFRRGLQVWCAAYFFVLQLFWIVHGFWWRSLPNWIAACFGLQLLNHGAVSLASSLTQWGWLGWWKAAGWSWGVEAGCWLGLALVILLCRRDRGAG